MENLKEIRINEYYVSRLTADYENGLSEESMPKTRSAYVHTDRFVRKIAEYLNEDKSETSLIPINCRFMKRGSKGILIVVEEPPAMRSIRVNRDLYNEAEILKTKGDWEKFGYEKFFEENERPFTFMLAVPFVLHIIMLSADTLDLIAGKVFVNTRPLIGMGDTIYLPPFLNVGSRLNVCFGDEVHKTSNLGLTRKVEHVVKTFWGATFNSDYIDHYLSYSEVPQLCDYFTWQYYSKTNPMFIFKADWIPYELKFGEVINSIVNDTRHFGTDRVSTFGYKTLDDLFNKPEISNEHINVREGDTRQLVYDITGGMHLDDDISAYNGDALYYSHGRIAYIDSFIGILGALQPYYVRLNVDGRLVRLKINRKVKEYMTDCIRALRYESSYTMPDGTQITPGDIVCSTTPLGFKRYYNLKYIRKAEDGTIEARVGSSYWLLDSVDWSKIEKVNIDEPEIDGMKIIKDKVYHFYNYGHVTSQMIKTHQVKFIEVTTGSANNLLLRFQNIISGESYHLKMGESLSKQKFIFEEEDLVDIPPTFACGRKIFSVYTNRGDIATHASKHSQYGIVCNMEETYSRAERDSIPEYFLDPSNQHFHVETPNLTIDFSVGDKVIVADWINPLNMLSVKTIVAFERNDSGSIYFILENRKGEKSQVEYVDGSYRLIRIGRIRKVINEIDGIKVGTKIVAKETGVSCFPKKDINMIVTFIIDTGGEPLAFCSNGCTLWVSDLKEKFDLIPMSSPNWKELQHSHLDPSKIKLQPGDIIISTESSRTSSGYLVVGSRGIGMRFTRLDSFHEYDDFVRLDRYYLNSCVLDCIPNPRMSIRQQNERGFVTSFPNFHGGIVPTKASAPYLLIDETRRF